MSAMISASAGSNPRRSPFKHSYYLIKNGDPRGFEPAEAEIIALITRYHRKSAPKKSHADFSALSAKTRRAVRTLAAILRFAETLDRSHAQAVTRSEERRVGKEGRSRRR